MIFDKGSKTIQWEKGSFVTNDAGDTGYPHAKEWSWAVT